MEQTLLEYVREALKYGLDISTVRQNLLAKAWDPALVDDALRAQAPPDAPTPPPSCSFSEGLGSNANASSSTADLLAETPEFNPNIKPAPVWNAEPPKGEDRAEPPSTPTIEDVDLKHWKKYYEFPKRTSGWLLIIVATLLWVGMSASYAFVRQSGILNASGKPPITIDEAARQQASLARSEAISDALNVGIVLSTLLFIFGIPIGVAKLGRRRIKPGTPYDQRSGPGENSSVPDEIKGWSWGAFGLNVWWGLYHGVWSSLLMLVPGINLIWIFVLGALGRQSAWRSVQWLNVEHFNRVQKIWGIWAAILLMLCVASTAVGLWYGLSQAGRLYGLMSGPYML